MSNPLRMFGDRIHHWARRAMRDVHDNIPLPEAPPIKEMEGSYDALRDRLLSPAQSQELLALTQAYEQNVPHEGTTIIGNRHEGTQHAHQFVIVRNNDAVNLWYIDPEDHVGREHPLRPRVVNLMHAIVHKDQKASVAILRYRTATVRDEARSIDTKDIDTLALQERDAAQLLQNDGIPNRLKTHERNITFRMIATDQKTIVQSRYVTPDQITDFLAGKPVPDIDAKIGAQHAIIEHFLRLVRAGDFHINRQNAILSS